MNNRKRESGFTLVETVIALAIVAILMGALAQGLATYHGDLDAAQGRIQAVSDCRTVLADMRRIRFDDPAAFPGSILDAYPQGSVLAAFTSLPNQAIVVQYADVQADPLDITVVCTWTNLLGQAMRSELNTLISSR